MYPHIHINDKRKRSLSVSACANAFAISFFFYIITITVYYCLNFYFRHDKHVVIWAQKRTPELNLPTWSTE